MGGIKTKATGSSATLFSLCSPMFFHPAPLGYLKTKESFLLKKEFNSHGIVLVHRN